MQLMCSLCAEQMKHLKCYKKVLELIVVRTTATSEGWSLRELSMFYKSYGLIIELRAIFKEFIGMTEPQTDSRGISNLTIEKLHCFQLEFF